MKALHPYVVFCGEPSEGSVLVFAHQGREARAVGAGEVMGWTDCGWLDLRVRRLRDDVAFLNTLADPGKWAADTAHVITDPHSCPVCERWGGAPVPDGVGCRLCVDGPECGP